MADLSREASSEKRRRRPPLACVACRRRKVRCDRKLPCQNCVRARRATSCAYVPDERLEPRETTQNSVDGNNRRNFDTDDVESATVRGGSFLGTGTAAVKYPQNKTNRDGEGEALRDRVRQLEKQLEQVLESRRAATDAPPGTNSPPLSGLHNNSGPSPAIDLEEEGRDRADRRPEYLLTTEPMGPSGTRPMLVKSMYLGGSHWMRGLSLVSRPLSLSRSFLRSPKRL